MASVNLFTNQPNVFQMLPSKLKLPDWPINSGSEPIMYSLTFQLVCIKRAAQGSAKRPVLC
jgi:hypothetical protein